MTLSGSKGPNSGPSGPDTVFEAGSAALRAVMNRSFARSKRKPEDDLSPEALSKSAISDSLASDPINSAIESVIIPRLMMAYSSLEDGEGASNEGPANAEGITIQTGQFAKLPLQLEAADLLKYIEAYMGQGIDFDAICVDVLAPAARALGDMWCRDECDFVDVTMGLWRLQEVMRALSARVPVANSTGAIPGAVLFAPLPGDCHAFGAQMLDEIFAKAGWLSEVIVKPQRRELLDRLSKQPFDLVGLTITRDSPVSAITSLVKTMRGVSANPRISVLIGGNMVNANPGIVDEVGADGTAIDAQKALRLAEKLVHASGQKALTLR